MSDQNPPPGDPSPYGSDPSGHDPYGPQDPHATDPYGQQDPYGQPGQYGTDPYGQPAQYGYGTQPYAYGAGGPPPSNNLVWAILATIFCCLPAGIVSIVYAAKVDNLWATGRQAEARNAARTAATWAWVSLGLAILLVVLVFGFGLLGALTSVSSSSSYEY